MSITRAEIGPVGVWSRWPTESEASVERMLREWQQALGRYRKRRGRTVDWDALEPIIQAQLESLRSIGSVDELRRKFTAGNYWALQICRRFAPQRPDLWDLHYTADVAFALRFLELTGGTEHDADQADAD